MTTDNDIAQDLTKLLGQTKAKLVRGESLPTAWALAVPYVRRSLDEIERLRARVRQLEGEEHRLDVENERLRFQIEELTLKLAAYVEARLS